MEPIIQDNDKVSERLARLAEEVFLMEQARNRHLPTDLVGDPAWSILLALYRQNLSLAVSDLCKLSKVPNSTAVRWIALLEQRGFLSQSQMMNPYSGEVCLTREGRALLERSLEAMLLVARG